MEPFESETGISKSEVTIDGGVSQNNLICQKISNLMQQRIVRRKDQEASARNDFIGQMINDSVLKKKT